MNENLLETKQIETEQIILHSPDSLNYITEKMIENTLIKLAEVYNVDSI